MKAPSIFVVVKSHRDFHGVNFVSWHFDKAEAERAAERVTRTEFSGASVEEVQSPDGIANCANCDGRGCSWCSR